MVWPTTTIVTTDMDAGTDSPATARAQIKQMADNVNAIKDAKGQASGIAELDSGGKVPAGQIPTISASQGGTGQTGFTVGDIFYANSTTTLAKLAAGSTGYVLKSNGAGAAPSWQLEGGGLTSGTRLGFQQTSAPTGWTKDTTGALNDSIMRIVTGSVASGGSMAFSTWAGQTSSGATTLSSGQIPDHTHTWGWQSGAGSGSYTVVNSASLGKTSKSTKPTNMPAYGDSLGGGSHTHSLSQNIKYYDFIVAQKD